MPAAFIYLLKLSVSLGVVFLFYQLVLRRLTFYNWNRWYLLGYTLLSFFIPFIDISNAIKEDQLTTNTILQWVPALYSHSAKPENSITAWGVLALFIIAGIVVMLVRLIVQLISFKRMMKKAELISGDEINLYQVNESIIPFSFGNSVFINKDLHTVAELEEIIRHEFVHVKQRHSIDIILSEIVCLLNWYNPFAWMLRSAIRQNLEFVADSKVLENGINKKQYQYLLLKVIGNNQFSIAQKFNFSSLKKRIAMMNKNKSTKMHLLRFLFLLPVLALILVSFRKEIGDTLTGKNKPLQLMERSISDTIPSVTEPNEKGYIINVIDRNGNCTLVIKDKKNKEVKRMLLTEWNANTEKYEAMYGELPPPPPPPPTPPVPPAPVEMVGVPTPPPPPAPVKLPLNIQKMNIAGDKVTVTLKNGEKENYDFSKPEQKSTFQKKYGDAFIAPPAPSVIEVDAKDNTVAVQEIQVTPAKLIAIKRQPAAIANVAIAQEVDVAPVKAIIGNPLIILDGTVISKVEMEAIRPENIRAIDVLKGEKAIAAFGAKADEGAILITTKSSVSVTPEINITADEVRTSDDAKDEVTVSSSLIELNNVKGLVMVDGKEYPAGKGKLSGTFNIVTLKKEEAIKKYGDKGKNGATEITTLK